MKLSLVKLIVWGLLMFAVRPVLGQESANSEQITSPRTFSQEELGRRMSKALAGEGRAAHQLYIYFLFAKNDEKEALKWLDIGAKSGDENSMLNYSNLYFGQGVGDKIRAISYLDKVYDSKDCELSIAAGTLLGQLYSNPKYEQADVARARQYLERSALFKDQKAVAELVDLYKASTLDIDKKKAYFWELIFYSRHKDRYPESYEILKKELRAQYRGLNFDAIEYEAYAYMANQRDCFSGKAH